MNRKLEQKHWDALWKMVHCSGLQWKCGDYDVSLKFPQSHREIIYLCISHDKDDFETQTLLRNSCYVGDVYWVYLKKGFDEFRRLERLRELAWPIFPKYKKPHSKKSKKLSGGLVKKHIRWK